MGIRVANIELNSSFAFLLALLCAVKSGESACEAFDLTIHHNRLRERFLKQITLW